MNQKLFVLGLVLLAPSVAGIVIALWAVSQGHKVKDLFPLVCGAGTGLGIILCGEILAKRRRKANYKYDEPTP